MAEASAFRILVADDNPQNLELIEAYLSDLDCDIQTAVDGEETLRKVRENPPDLLLLDIMMPKVSGFEVCRKLKGEAPTRGVPILMVTALHEQADIDRAVEAGADDYLSKPIHKQILLRRAKALLKVRQLSSELERTLAYLKEVEGARQRTP